MKYIVRQIYIKVLAILLVSIFLTPIIGHTVYAYEMTSNSIMEFGSVHKEMIVGERQSLSNLLVFDNKVIGKTNKKVQYKSNNPTVIRIENDEIIAESKGIATITASCENKESSVAIRVYDTQYFANTKENSLKVSLKWKREQSKVSLSWTESDALVGFKILRKEINQSDYTEIIKDGVGNTFLDEDVLPDHEYLYKIFLKDKKDKEFALNELSIPVYHPIRKEVKEPIIENTIDIKALEEFIKTNYKLTTIPDTLIENKPNIIFEIDKEELEKLIKEKLAKELNLETADSPASEDKHVPLLEDTEISKEKVIVKDITKENIDNEKVSDKEVSPKEQELLKGIPGSWEAIKVKKEEILDGSQKKLKLSYYYGEELDITENNLVIYSMDTNGNMSEVPGITVDNKNKVVSFITDKESNYCFEIKVDEENESKDTEKSPEEKQPSKEAKKSFKEEALPKDISVDENKEKVLKESSTLVEIKEDKVETISAEPKETIENKKEEVNVVEKKVDTPKIKVNEVQPKEDKKEASESTDKTTTIETKTLNSFKEGISSESKVSKDIKQELTTDNKLPNKNDKTTKKDFAEVKENKSESLKENSNKNLEKEESSKIEPNKKEDVAPSVDNKAVDKTEKVNNEKDSKVKKITPITSTYDKPLNIKKEEPKEEVKEVVTKTEVETTEEPVAKKRRKRSLDMDEFAADAKMETGATVYSGPGSSNYASIGSVDSGEEIRAIASEWGWIYITYRVGNSNTYKRGFVVKNQLQNASYIYEKKLNEMYLTGSADRVIRTVSVFSGPGSDYATIGTVYGGEGVTVFDEADRNCIYSEFSTPSGTKRGYIYSSSLRGLRSGTLASVTSKTTIFGCPGANAAITGAVYTKELVVILAQNDMWYYIEYNTPKGRKRGYCFKNSLDIRGKLNCRWISQKKSVGESTANRTVYGGPNQNYATMGSINYKEKVAILDEYEPGYTSIEYGTKVGLKRGFVSEGTVKAVNNISLPSIPTNSKVTKGVYGHSGKGRELAYYKIGNGSKALVAVFAIHGFEDAWPSDGVELCKMASDTIRDLSNMGDLNGWTAYIIPTANPDGVIEGFTNDGPGRCTVADQTDLNRSFPTNPISFPNGSRNYNGGRALVAGEAINLNNFIHKTKNKHSSMVLLDIHGWEDKTIGNPEIGAYFGEQFGFGNIEKYPQGFLITEGKAIGAKSTLVELPMPSSSNDIKNRGFSQKVSRAIQNIIKRNAGTSTKAVDSTKVTPVDAKQGKVINVTSHLNIRKGAGTNFDIVGTLKPNQVVDLYGQVDNWYKIYLGYVSKDFIEKLKDTSTPVSKPKAETTLNKKGQVVNVTSHLNIRKGAGTNFDIVGTLKPNEIVDIYGENGEWYKLHLGYANKNYIKIINDTSNSSKPILRISINKKGKVKINVLEIKDSPSFNANVIRSLKKGDPVTVLEKIQGWHEWYKLKIDCFEGYALVKHIDLDKSDAHINKKGRVRINVLPIKDKPSFKANAITELSLNDIVTITETLHGWNDWYKIKRGSSEGYVLVEHIQALDDPSKEFTKHVKGVEIKYIWREKNGKYDENPSSLKEYEKIHHACAIQVSPQKLISFIIGLTPLDLPKDLADFYAGKDIITGEEIDRRILFACLFLPEVGDQILKKVGKNSDKLIALAEKEFKANKDVIKKEYQAAVEKSGQNLDEIIDKVKTEIKVEKNISKTEIRLLNKTIDAEFINTINKFKNKLPKWAIKKGNFGCAQVNIENISKKEFFAHSAIQDEIESVRGTGISIKPNESILKPIKVNENNIIEGSGAWLRDVDTEFKILSEIQSKLGKNYSTKGKIKLFTELECCPSCLDVINQFKKLYKNIEIEVIYKIKK